MNSVLNRLSAAGLNQNEARVYLAVLQAGECSIGEVQRVTGLHRQLIYNAAETLAQKALLNSVREGGPRRFRASDPGCFVERAEAQVRQARNLSKELEQLRHTSGFTGEARIYTGATEIQRYYLEAIARQPLRSRVDILGVDSGRYFEIFPIESSAFRNFELRRLERKVKWRLLLSGNVAEELALNQTRPLLECRLLTQKVAAPIDIMAWSDHVGLLIYGAAPCVLDIPGSAAARGFKKYLSILWNQGETVI
ncbi:MAG: hypothetical protein K1X83_00860 [Oligoflexia bacterium]|nr:hypothetical protein [Oligoflexia bacterium]